MIFVKAENARKDIPLVSIIAICYNHSQYLEETLNSILNQTYENIELIIIDSNSSDNSVKIIQNWINKNGIDCHFIKQTKPRNICQNLNEGLKYISGIYYQGLSCDDILIKSKIQKQVAVLEKSDDNVAFTFSNAYFIDENNKIINDRGDFIKFYKRNIEPDFDNLYENLLYRNFIPAMSVLIKSHKVSELGNYDEKLKYEDYDLWLRLLQNGDKAIFQNKILCYYRIHNHNLHLTLKNDWLIQNYWIKKKHLHNPVVINILQDILLVAINSNDSLNNSIIIDYKHLNVVPSFEKICLNHRFLYRNYINLLRIFKHFSL